MVRSDGLDRRGRRARTPEYEVNPEPLGRCPFDEECDVVESPTQFVCEGRLKALDEKAARSAAAKRGEAHGAAPEAKPCGFVLPRTVCKREITREEALALPAQRAAPSCSPTSPRASGARSRRCSFLKENGRHGFEFPPRGQAAEGAAPRAEGEAGAAAPGRKRPPRARARAAEPAVAPAEERTPARKARRPRGERGVARRAASPKTARVVRRSRRKRDGGSGATESPREA